MAIALKRSREAQTGNRRRHSLADRFYKGKIKTSAGHPGLQHCNWIIFQVPSASAQLLFQGERVVQQLRWVDWVQFPLRRVDQGDPRGFFFGQDAWSSGYSLHKAP